MDTMLGETKGEYTWIHIDDLDVFSTNEEEHLRHLEDVLRRARAINLKFKISKCQFGMKRMAFLGHVISAEGIETDSTKIETVKRCRPPKNIGELRSFLGLAGYYRRFISDFSRKARPLTNLLKKDSMWNWSKKCQKAMDKLKDALSSAPVLIY